MNHYKIYDPKFAKLRCNVFWFRRYAPFDEFGGGTGYQFEGDHRIARLMEVQGANPFQVVLIRSAERTIFWRD
jgi:hypothetical protein